MTEQNHPNRRREATRPQQPSGGRAQPGRAPARQPVRPRRSPRRSGFNPVLAVIIGLLILGTGLMIYLCLNIGKGPEKPQTPAPQIHQEQAEKPEKKPFFGKENKETEPPAPTAEPIHVVSTATVRATGDLLMHKSLFNQTSAVYNKETKEYNFDSLFKFVHDYVGDADYAIANLETTLYGPGKPYSGNPRFNTPDQLIDSVKSTGFDMLLTANNHCNDTELDGILRTLEVVREKGLQTLGTNLTNEEEKYVIQEINGINIGMLCYTYEDSRDPRLETFNYIPLAAKGKGLVCDFPKFPDKSREPFYETLEAQIGEMRDKGADAIVLFLHWGEEYHLEASQDQKNMAQRLCDMGVDLIVGGHPHVIQPVELLTSTRDPEHRTVCLYSMGNAVSNQRREEMTRSCPTGHTEDGMFFEFTFEKYSDGSVYLAGVNVIPTWVDMYVNPDGLREYNILPLEDSRRDQWQSLYSISDSTYQSAAASYDRTMAIVEAGLIQSNTYLSEAKQQRDAEYQAAVS